MLSQCDIFKRYSRYVKILHLFGFKIYQMEVSVSFIIWFFSFNFVAFFLFFNLFLTLCLQSNDNFISINKYLPYGQLESNSDYFSQIGSHGSLISNNEREITFIRQFYVEHFLVFSVNNLILDFLWYRIYAVLPKNINKSLYFLKWRLFNPKYPLTDISPVFVLETENNSLLDAYNHFQSFLAKSLTRKFLSHLVKLVQSFISSLFFPT